MARWWLYKRLKGGYGSGGGAIKAAVEKQWNFFSPPLRFIYLFISPSCAGQQEFCPGKTGQKVEIAALKVFHLLF